MLNVSCSVDVLSGWIITVVHAFMDGPLGLRPHLGVTLEAGLIEGTLESAGREWSGAQSGGTKLNLGTNNKVP